MNRLSKAPIWLKIIIGLLGLVVIAGVTIVVLILISPKNTVKTASSDTSKPKIANAQKLFDAYLASSDIKERNTIYKPVSNSPTNTYIQYTSNNQPFGITLTAPLRTQYQRNDTTSSSNTPGIVTTTEAFLDGLDVKKSKAQTLDVLTSVLFEGPTVVCQTDSWQKLEKQPATYGLACIDKSAIDSSYKQLAILFKLTNGALSSSAIKSLTETDINNGTEQQLTVLTTANNKNSSTVYYFVTSDKKTWNYLGERPTPSVNDKDSFQIPVKLQEAINSSKLKDFLNTYIR